MICIICTSFFRRMFVQNIKLERKDELKQISIKNLTCYYFCHIIKFWDRNIDFSYI